MANYPTVFVVNTVEESDYSSGPMFATKTKEVLVQKITD